jgi:8-amino-7-oxononanoate synthase
MTSPSLAWLGAELDAIRDRELFRSFVDIETGQGPEIVVDGRTLILFASNDYLGLTADPRIRAAAVAAVEAFGTGAGGSRLISGNSVLHRRLERALADLEEAEDAIVFPTGYQANLGTITSLVGRGDAVFSDELNHASIIDGCRFSGAEVVVYPHGSVEALAGLLRDRPGRRRLIVTDTVFSMDGDLAPLADLASLAETAGAMLMVDEAHATGVLGAQGAGAVEHFGLRGRVPVVMGTLSKALAASGGYVAGDASLVAFLRNRARSFIFTTGLSPASAGAALAALRVVHEEPERRQRIRAMASHLAAGLRAQGYRVLEPQAAIVSVLVGETGGALALAAALREAGMFAPAIRPPTVPPGTARIRLSLMATHTPAHVERCLAAFAAARESLPC